MTEHELKTIDIYFDEVERGNKLFELRNNDRNFKIGDTLILKRIKNGTLEYTGQQITCKITYILNNPFFVFKNHVILSIIPENYKLIQKDDLEFLKNICKERFNPNRILINPKKYNMLKTIINKYKL